MSVPSNKDNLIDITDLLRSCASQCLSHSHPFTPSHDDLDVAGPSDSVDELTQDLDGLLTVTSLKSTGEDAAPNNDTSAQERGSTAMIIPVNLRDAMSALELGDKRMDCCEIPVMPPPPLNSVDAKLSARDNYTKMYDDAITIPPRIAPKNLSDGTPSTSSLVGHNPISSPCPSLLPYWNNLVLSSIDSPTCLLPLMLLQYTALEAYIGVNSGGSSASETLFCMLWCHEGVLMDMASRLDVVSTTVDHQGVIQENSSKEEEELTVAQWALFASSLGIVRIAQTVRCIVHDADIYEEEDFGIDWDCWGEMKLCHQEDVDIEIEEEDDDLNTVDPMQSDFGFSQEGRLINRVWSIAISKLERFNDNKKNDTIEAIVLLLKSQRSFYIAIQLLYNVKESNVGTFTELASKFSRETVDLFHSLRGCLAVEEMFTKHDLLASDGRLCTIGWLSSPEKNEECSLFLGASFDPFVNRRLLGNAPIRKARFNPIDRVIDSMSNLVSELEWAVCDVLLYADTLGRLTRMLSNNSLRGSGGAVLTLPKSDGEAYSPVGINILSRSLMLLNLYFDDKLLGQYDFVDIIGQNMVQLAAAPGAMVETIGWMARLSKPLYNTLKALCFDRHRERLFTESVLLPAFGTLQEEAAAIDEMFREANDLDPATTPYATNYVIMQTLRLMERHVGLGIELGLYPHWYDLSQAYWYRDYLLTALVNVQGAMERVRLERKLVEHQIKLEQEEEEKKYAHHEHGCTSKKASGKKKKGKKSRALSTLTTSSPRDRESSTIEALSKISPETFEDRIDFTVKSVHRSLCRGMVRLIAALRQANLLKEPSTTMTLFTSEKRRFDKRFDVFSDLPHPSRLSFEDYKMGSDFSAVNREDLIASVKECFRAGKASVDRLLEVILPSDTEVTPIMTEQRKNGDLYISIRRKEIMALAKVCVSNSLSLFKLETALDGRVIQEALTFVCSSHKAYCAVKL